MRLILAIVITWASLHALVAGPATVRLGVLKFGTASWEIETIRHHRLDHAGGIAVVPRELATNEAAKIALQADAVDVIVADWPWVARQRAEGADFTFVPYSAAVGALVVPSGSAIAGLVDLKGKRLGVAGGPLDKSWLLLQALVRRELGIDPMHHVEPVFAAPPLLNEEFARGRNDAVLTYWHYAARLEAAGAKRLLTVSDIARRLGVGTEVPLLGYVFRESWARANPATLRALIAASRAAKNLLASSEEEWRRLAPLIGTADPAVLVVLREGYRDGIPAQWGRAEEAAAAQLFAVLAEIGGQKLVGRAARLDPQTFWTPSSD